MGAVPWSRRLSSRGRLNNTPRSRRQVSKDKLELIVFGYNHCDNRSALEL